MMKTLRNLVLIAGMVLVSTYTTQAQMLKEYSAFHKSLGLTLGNLGIGVEGSYPIGLAFNARAGATFFPNIKVGKPGQPNKYKFERTTIGLMLDWQPLFGKESNFASKWFVTVGASYFFKNDLAKYGSGDYENPEYTIKFKQAPYIGTGLGNLVVSDRLSLSLNAGYYFEYSDAIVRRTKTGARLPNLDGFPTVILKGLDLHAGLSYNF